MTTCTNNDLDDGMCIGSDMKAGCPHNAKALPSTAEVRPGLTTKIMNYHCAACLEIYRRRYDQSGEQG